jgi:MarR family transcriptional regulator, transcriptional regulator for hemolysin
MAEMSARANQRQFPDAVGVSEATLSYHLNAMETDGLLARRRDPSNRRNHIIELAPLGGATFTRLAATALAFDQQLRADLEPDDLPTLRALPDQLCIGARQPGPQRPGLHEAAAEQTPRKRTRILARKPDPEHG